MPENSTTPHTPESVVLQWQTIISTQMHFNDMILRTRAIGASAVLAVYGYAASVLIKDPTDYEFILDNFVPTAAIVVIFGLVLLLAIFFVDFVYYYKLLLASVEVGREFENRNSSLVQQTTNIGKQVPLWRANLAIAVFYFLPLTAGIPFLWHIWIHYPPQIHT